MNIALWILAGLLAAVFTMAGLVKATQSREKLAPQMPFVNDVSMGLLKFIGVAEVLGAIGLVLPAAVDVAPVLTLVAATGLAATMALATIVHIRRKEPFVPTLVLFALTTFLAVMRFGPYAF